MPTFEQKEDPTWAKELLPTSSPAQAHSDPALEPPPLPPGEDWDRPFTRLHYAALTAPGPTGTRAEHVTTCSACLDGSMPTCSTQRFWRCSARSLLARFLPPRDGSHARDFAGSARKMASQDPSSQRQAARQSAPGHPSLKVLRMHQWGISLPGVPVRVSATGAAPLNPGGQRHVRAACRGRSGPGQHVWQRRVATHPPSPSHALPGSTPSRLCHHPPHRSHFRLQLGSRAGSRAWHYPECAGVGTSA